MIRRSAPARTSRPRRQKPIARTSRPRRQRKGGRAALKRKCNRLWSALIRASGGGVCWLAGKDHVRCGGPIQGAHCFGKGPFPGVRYELWNGLPTCAGHHVWYTHNPEAWAAVLTVRWGAHVYNVRHLMAQRSAKPDYAAIAAELERLSA